MLRRQSVSAMGLLALGLVSIVLGLVCARHCARHLHRAAVLHHRSLPIPKPGQHWWEVDSLGPEKNNEADKVEFLKETFLEHTWGLLTLGLLCFGIWAISR